ncbi:formylglycine-generating enzyme family protein [Chondromyces apiculatus]|uniref:Putative serine/threonine protein kinase n=1 Tax=Chondromyces apiculatus DSM 436 TaxID=1192034 RepID=A0A017SWP0_9BACT|nr:SUMF1/EgtB/PvdO family nonheme iron enzyme [Chondromyces apiculatus]EYF00736.1 putative serine/threonine protein kinase [Chondromyces apiculatus DSM 436]
MNARTLLGTSGLLALALGAFVAAGCQGPAYCYADCEPAAGTGGAGGSGGEGGDDLGLGGTPNQGGGPPCTADVQNDIENCGACDNRCLLPSAFPRCEMGACVIDDCVDGSYDLDGNAGNGCEYTCPVAVLGPEQCNGIDDDCDGLVDGDDPDLVFPTTLCTIVPGTPCEDTQVVCNGAAGFGCVYPPDVEVVSGFVRHNETRCDGIDGNCDGDVDEWFADLGDDCSDNALGQCADHGVRICDPQNAGRTICDLSVLPDPMPPSPEQCNGVDDDCDGFVDEDLPPSAFAMAPLLSNASVFVDRFEASRPDATAAMPGILETVACSTSGVLPWTGGSFSEAEAACAARGPGFRLCTAAELEDACRGATDTLYPYGSNYAGTACNGVDRNASGVVSPTGSIASCNLGSPSLADLSGNVTEWTRTQTNAAQAPDRIFQLHGGSYLSPAMGLACTMELPARAAEGTLLPNIGFRCCRQ